jgi:hypothetical protein
MSGLPRRRMRRLAQASMLACDHFVERRFAPRGLRPLHPRPSSVLAVFAPS